MFAPKAANGQMKANTGSLGLRALQHPALLQQRFSGGAAGQLHAPEGSIANQAAPGTLTCLGTQPDREAACRRSRSGTGAGTDGECEDAPP